VSDPIRTTVQLVGPIGDAVGGIGKAARCFRGGTPASTRERVPIWSDRPARNVSVKIITGVAGCVVPRHPATGDAAIVTSPHITATVQSFAELSRTVVFRLLGPGRQSDLNPVADCGGLSSESPSCQIRIEGVMARSGAIGSILRAGAGASSDIRLAAAPGLALTMLLVLPLAGVM
jgi:hypothetical protein